MKHFGDITKIKGSEVPLTEIVVGGSPCQDLSVAGKRAGLAGARSGLFMEQIRLIKEMRENDRKNGRTDEHIRPRYMVWENVPGAFSSNKGEDFRAVLEETAKVAEGDACIPRLEKWPHAGCIMGDGWSLAWRLHDAQFWGVPQRRERIALVADFGGATAPEILFERKGLSRDTSESGEEGQRITKDVEGSIGETISFQERAGKPGGGKGILIQNERIGALSTLNNQPVCYRKTSHAKSKEDGQGWQETEVNDTLNIFDNGESETMYTLNSTEHHAVAVENHPNDSRVKISEDGKVQTLSSRMGTGGGNVPMVLEEPYTSSKESYHQEKVGTQVAQGPGAVCQSVVRRLTPLECERLQGFPDGWTDIGEWYDSKGKKHKDADSPRYKALGNSIALPFWQWMAERMVRLIKNDEPEKEPTMASLFDGIGGFPLVYSRCGCKPVWASEVEEFSIAVTKIRFSEENK